MSRFARPYAKALLQSTSGDEEAVRVRAELGDFAQATAQIPAIRRMSTNPVVPPEVREGVVGQICDKLEMGRLSKSLIVLLTKNFRLVHLDAVLAAVDDVLNRRRGVVVAEVTSAHTLDEDRRQRLGQVLERTLEQKVDLTVKTDPALLAGFIARIGSYRYDASLDGQLSRLAGALAQEN